MPPKRKIPFNSKHLIEFGFKIVEREASSSRVVSVSCLFFLYFRREEKVGAKSKATTNVMYFKQPFQSDTYKRHMETQHPDRWKQYSKMDTTGKEDFFKDNSPIRHNETLLSHFSGVQNPIHQFVSNKIANVIIGEMFYQEDEEITNENALSIFDLQPDCSTVYRVVIKNSLQFHRIVNYLSVSLSFRMAQRVLVMSKERTGVATIGNINENKVRSYAKIVCALNLEVISTCMQLTWAFSLAIDISTHMATSYLDIQIHLFKNYAIYELHLLAILMFTRHTCEQIFIHASKSLYNLDENWRNNILLVATDGEKKMTGHIQGMVTRIEQCAKPGFFRIWCGLHQLELCLQKFYSDLIDQNFYQTMKSLIFYLRPQYNLVNNIVYNRANFFDLDYFGENV